MIRQSISQTLNRGSKFSCYGSGVSFVESLPFLQNHWLLTHIKSPITETKSHHTLSSSSEHLKFLSSAHQVTNKQLVRNIVRRRRLIRGTVTELPERFKMHWPKISLFGDSITRRANNPDEGCWASFIANQVGSYFDVDSRGFEGYNTKWGLELMPKLFPKSYLDQVEIFIPFFGHNDSWEPNSPLHVPLAQFEANMRAIIKYLLNNGVDKKKIIMITPGWYFDPNFQEFLKTINMPPNWKTLEDAKNYRDAVVRIAKDEGIDFVDFFEISLNHKPLEELFCDGIHFSTLGARILYEQLMPIIKRKIEASFNKPLADLWHALPWDQQPEVITSLENLKNKSS